MNRRLSWWEAFTWGREPPPPPPRHPRETWHVIEASRLVALLRRAHEGENPELLYIEEYVNAEREEVEADDE